MSLSMQRNTSDAVTAAGTLAARTVSFDSDDVTRMEVIDLLSAIAFPERGGQYIIQHYDTRRCHSKETALMESETYVTK